MSQSSVASQKCRMRYICVRDLAITAFAWVRKSVFTCLKPQDVFIIYTSEAKLKRIKFYYVASEANTAIYNIWCLRFQNISRTKKS